MKRAGQDTRVQSCNFFHFESNTQKLIHIVRNNGDSKKLAAHTTTLGASLGKRFAVVAVYSVAASVKCVGPKKVRKAGGTHSPLLM